VWYTESTPSLTPLIEPSQAPKSTNSPITTVPTTASNLKICQYSSYCRSDSDCVLGNKCNDPTNPYFTQCIPDASKYLTAYCVASYGHCSSSTDVCCDPGAVCSSGYSQCMQPSQSSGLCISPSGFSAVPASTLSPSSSSSPSGIPSVQPTSPSCEPTMKPSKPTTTSTATPSSTSTVATTASPVVSDPLCCDTTSYASSWTYCNSAAGLSMSSCSTCAAYQCIDWTAGSVAMQAREASYLAATGDSVYFGVGSYGNDQSRAGKCYRITASGVDRDLIVQVVNQGGDVPDGNFDLQVGDGGYGAFDACVADGTSVPQFDGSGSQWGAIYGGWSDISGCSNLPAFPHCGSAPADNMQDLCRWSFQKNIRVSTGNSNPTITNMCEVKCPSELWQATGLHRSDETNPSYTCGLTGNSGGGLMTRMMDCTKPSYGWNGNVKGTTYAGFELVVPCRRDGYTRINAMVPSTVSPSKSPTSATPLTPSQSPTMTPSAPSKSPSFLPSATPTCPSAQPSSPSCIPSLSPTSPTVTSTILPTPSPTYTISIVPSNQAVKNLTGNPFNRTLNYYVNPTYQAELQSSIVSASGQVKATLQSMMHVSSAYWIDVKAKILGTDTTSVEGILTDAASKELKQLVTLIIYDLPNRDCHVNISYSFYLIPYSFDSILLLLTLGKSFERRDLLYLQCGSYL